MSRPCIFLLALFMVLPGVAAASDEDDDTMVTSYRHLTLSADAISIGLFAAGNLAEGEGGHDTPLSNTLFATGLLGATFATPIIHATRGHGGRAIGSWLLRQGLASAGMLIAFSASQGCDDGWFCELEYVGYGYLGGIVLASVIDAATITDEVVPRERAPRSVWSPTISATHQGARVGFVATF
jgi:hypothetical protein